jgi:hypothetical protein
MCVALTNRTPRCVAINTYSRRSTLSKKKARKQPESKVAETTSPAADAKAPNKNGKAKKKETSPQKMSCLDAAAKVLSTGGAAMTTKEMIESMAKKNLWSTPNGKTPAATLYSAILREINVKARFKKTERGKFATK